jgi:hypothetical protein
MSMPVTTTACRERGITNHHVPGRERWRPKMPERTTEWRKGSTSDALIWIHTPTKSQSVDAVRGATKTKMIEENWGEAKWTKRRVAESSSNFAYGVARVVPEAHLHMHDGPCTNGIR